MRRLKEGLKTLGVLECIQQHADVMQAAFVNVVQTIHATMVERLFTVQPLSDKESNKYSMEIRMLSIWRDYLQDLEGLLNRLT